MLVRMEQRSERRNSLLVTIRQKVTKVEKRVKLEIRRMTGEGIYDYALYRLDRTEPIICGISKKHAEHLKIIVGRMADIPESIAPIKDWFMYDDILSDEEIKALRK